MKKYYFNPTKPRHFLLAGLSLAAVLFGTMYGSIYFALFLIGGVL